MGGLNRNYYQRTIPTNEDKLDINFRSIVSTLKHIVYGGLTPRPWSDISSTWFPETHPRVRKIHTVEKPKKVYYKKVKVNQGRVNRMTQILIAGGMAEGVARIKAIEILTPPEEGNGEVLHNTTTREDQLR